MTEAVAPAGWVREPAVAGLFYPADADALAGAVRRFVRDAPAPEPAPDGADAPPNAPAALIAPHAGYRYSGATAGVAYRALAERPRPVERVVLIGPAHRVPVAGPGVGVSTAEAWRTPLGDVAVDVDAGRALVAAGLAVEADEAHAPEHSLEVHLPFVLEVLGPVPIVPLVVGHARAATAAAAVAHLWDDDSTLVVVSSDLSHYLDDDRARARDARTGRAIVEGRATDIGPHDACGCVPIAALLVAARSRGLAARTLAMATSADASGDVSRVVGYGSFAVAPPRPLTGEERAWLLARAREALSRRMAAQAADADAAADDAGDLADTDPVDGYDADVPERLRMPGRSFVTLERDGELAGCIGSLAATRPLWRDVVLNALGAAFADPRFTPLAPDQLDDVVVKVSVLSEQSVAPSARDELVAALRPGVDGLLLEAGDRRATFLPSVWRTVDEPAEFVRALLAKAGVDGDGWPDGLRAWRYTTDEFAEPAGPASGSEPASDEPAEPASDAASDDPAGPASDAASAEPAVSDPAEPEPPGPDPV